MRHIVPILLSTFALSPATTLAQSSPEIHVAYETYAAGFDVAHVEVGFGIDPAGYEVRLTYHTTGLVGFFYRGHQLGTVQGGWNDDQPEPREFYGAGVWRGEDRLTRIVYQHGQPVIRDLIPPQETERELVPMEMRQNSIDTLSALALMIHQVGKTGRCEAQVRTFDGRRAVALSAHTIGNEMLPPTGRSSFSGVALRCDFVGWMLAGYRLDDRDPAARRPLHGSAWLAVTVPGGPPVPVRLRFETRWVGDATMYLTEAVPDASTEVASH